MADTIREIIMKNVATALGNMSIANGYNNNFALIQRFAQSGMTAANVPAVFIKEGDEEASDAISPNLVAKKLHVHLAVITRQDESTDSRSADELMNSLRGDVEKAMMADYTRGGYAIDTKNPSSMDMDVQDGQPEIGTVLTFEIDYRHGRNNPYSLN